MKFKWDNAYLIHCRYSVMLKIVAIFIEKAETRNIPSRLTILLVLFSFPIHWTGITGQLTPPSSLPSLSNPDTLPVEVNHPRDPNSLINVHFATWTDIWQSSEDLTSQQPSLGEVSSPLPGPERDIIVLHCTRLFLDQRSPPSSATPVALRLSSLNRPSSSFHDHCLQPSS